VPTASPERTETRIEIVTKPTILHIVVALIPLLGLAAAGSGGAR
jgi:hypothetical protein